MSNHRPWLAVACETCHAGEGALCRIDGLGDVAFAHPARLTAWTTLTIQRVAGTMAEPYRGRWRDLPAPNSPGAMRDAGEEN